MRNTYMLQITARCPADGRPDVYSVRVRSSRVIPVEDILAAVKEATREKAYQEEITRELHRALAAEVTTFGVHSGVRAVCVCGQNEA